MNQQALAFEQENKTFEECRRQLRRVELCPRENPAAGPKEGAIVDERLRQSEERYRNLVESAGDIIFTLSANGLITSLNPAFETITGWKRKDWIGRPLISLLDPIDEHLFVQMLERVLRGEKVPLLELHMRSCQGEDITVELTASPHVVDGRVEGLFCNFRDITRVLKLERQLRQAQKMEAIGTLSGSIAHDFNNILIPIMVYTELAISKVEDGELPELSKLEEVLNAAMRAKSLVKQILTYSRRTGQETQPVKVRDIIEESIRLLRASLPSTIDIQQHLTTEAKILGDPTQIQQVVMNLCTNAFQAMRENGGTLRIDLSEVHYDQYSISRYSGLGPGSYLHLLVRDSGHGIEPRILEKIFDPFFTTKGPREGTGLGLTIVYGIVKSHGGIITVKSEPGKGSTFKILLPVIDDAQKREKMAVTV